MKLSRVAKATILGTVCAAVVMALLGHWFGSGATSGKKTQIDNRQATIHAMALADLAEADAARTEGEPGEALAQLASRWRERHDAVVDLRIIRLSGSRLLASTFEADLNAGDPPRRLQRDEKPLYDLGNEIRAAIDTNRDEGVLRKEEVVIDYPGGGLVAVAAPYFDGDRMAGFVQVQARANTPNQSQNWTPALLMALIPCLLVFLLALAAGRGDADAPLGRQRLKLVLPAALILLASWWFFRDGALTALRDAVIAQEAFLAEQYLTAKESARELAAEIGAPYQDPIQNDWDVDAFRQPYNAFNVQGQVDDAAVDAGLTGEAKTLKNGLLGNLILGLLVFAFFALGWSTRLRNTLSENRHAYTYVLPAMIGMLFLVFFPFIYGIALSFTGQTLYNTDKALTEIWIGFQNYAEILFRFDLFSSTPEGLVWNYNSFYWTLFITVCWTVINVIIGVTVGLVLALVLNNPTLGGKTFYRTILILPWAIPNYVTSLIWKGLFHQQFGPINQVLQILGLEPVAWFDSPFTSFLTGIATNGWLSFPFMMVICLGALQSINKDMYEAAMLDGASRWSQFRYITLPALKPTLIPAIIISVIWTFNMFNVIYLVSGGEPAGSNEILITKAYKIAFEQYQYGYAAAYSTIIFLILLAYGVFQVKYTKATESNA